LSPDNGYPLYLIIRKDIRKIEGYSLLLHSACLTAKVIKAGEDFYEIKKIPGLF
jgi:hypothetical protein